jgi:general secretion pathway protein E
MLDAAERPTDQPSAEKCLPCRPEFEARLGEYLLASARLDPAGLERARKLREAGGERLERVIAHLGLVGEAEMARATAELLRLPLVHAADWPVTPVLEAELSRRFLRRACLVPLADGGADVTLAMADPLDAFARRAVELAVEKPVRACVAAPSDIEAHFERLYQGGRGRLGQIVDEIAGTEAVDEDAVEDVARLRDLASEAPVIRLVNHLIARAVESRASDIHIEPFENRLIVRYRVDGLLREVASPPARLRAATISRIKIMAKLNIAERRLPQDGRIRIAIRGRDYDLRVATVPTLHGEGVTMRILDRASLVEDFGELGFPDDTLATFLEIIQRPQGIVLVTGPTGSGKTTTLYTALMRLNSPERKLFTVEDPIEYQLEGVNQVQVKPQIGLGFAQVLRTLLRHNPDIIMIGEMRDLETAQIAIQSALTGHLVLSTLHTNDAAGSITRLLDMEVEGYLVTSTVNGVMAQRLVRRLCRECRSPYRALPELVDQLRLGSVSDQDGITLFAPKGCGSCAGTGYHGQTALMELLPISDTIRRLVLRRAETRELHRAAVAEGMRTMYADGILKARAGITSIEEVLRVTRDM